MKSTFSTLENSTFTDLVVLDYWCYLSYLCFSQIPKLYSKYIYQLSASKIFTKNWYLITMKKSQFKHLTIQQSCPTMLGHLHFLNDIPLSCKRYFRKSVCATFSFLKIYSFSRDAELLRFRLMPILQSDIYTNI